MEHKRATRHKKRAKWNEQRARNITTTLLPKLYATKEIFSQNKIRKSGTYTYSDGDSDSHYDAIAHRHAQRVNNERERESKQQQRHRPLRRQRQKRKQTNKETNDSIWHVRMLVVYVSIWFKQMQAIHCLCLLKQNPAHTETLKCVLTHTLTHSQASTYAIVHAQHSQFSSTYSTESQNQIKRKVGVITIQRDIETAND